MLPQRSLKWCFLLVLLVGCPKRIVDLGPRGEPRSPADLLSRVDEAEAQVFSVQGEAKLWLDTPQGKGSVTVFVAVSHPALVHFEQLDFFGRPQSVFTTDGQRFGLYQVQEGRYFRGPATPANLSRFLPLTMPPRELATILLGRAPRIGGEPSSIKFDAEQGLFELVLAHEGVRQTLLVAPPSYRPVKSFAKNINAYAVSFDELSPERGVVFPRRVTVRAEGAQTSIELQWKELTLNQAPDLSLFDLEPPEGIDAVEVDE